MGKLGERLTDRRLLGLIHRYLKAGAILLGGRYESASSGVPQGGPLSPLLSNILLDELDKEQRTRSSGASLRSLRGRLCHTMREPASRRTDHGKREALRRKATQADRDREPEQESSGASERSHVLRLSHRAEEDPLDREVKETLQSRDQTNHPTDARRLAEEGDGGSSAICQRGDQVLRDRFDL